MRLILPAVPFTRYNCRDMGRRVVTVACCDLSGLTIFETRPGQEYRPRNKRTPPRSTFPSSNEE